MYIRALEGFKEDVEICGNPDESRWTPPLFRYLIDHSIAKVNGLEEVL